MYKPARSVRCSPLREGLGVCPLPAPLLPGKRLLSSLGVTFCYYFSNSTPLVIPIRRLAERNLNAPLYERG